MPAAIKTVRQLEGVIAPMNGNDNLHDEAIRTNTFSNCRACSCHEYRASSLASSVGRFSEATLSKAAATSATELQPNSTPPTPVAMLWASGPSSGMQRIGRPEDSRSRTLWWKMLGAFET